MLEHFAHRRAAEEVPPKAPQFRHLVFLFRLAHGALDAPIAYYRLPGPAGHKSRYEDPAIEKLAVIARDAKHKDATYVFTNVDMFADAKRFKKAMKLP